MARFFPIHPKRRAKPGENQVYKGSPQPDNHQSASDVGNQPCSALRDQFDPVCGQKKSPSGVKRWPSGRFPSPSGGLAGEGSGDGSVLLEG